MTTATTISVEEYLRTSYDGLDREYRDGEVIERGMPTNEHSLAQGNLIYFFTFHRNRLRLYPRPELRLRLSVKLIRIPDVCLFKDAPPTESVPTSPPYIAIEILSPDDKMTQVIEKLDEYATWGVTHIWFVDLFHKKLFTYAKRELHEVPQFQLTDPNFTVMPQDIFTE